MGGAAGSAGTDVLVHSAGGFLGKLIRPAEDRDLRLSIVSICSRTSAPEEAAPDKGLPVERGASLN